MHCQLTIDAQCCKTKSRAEEMERGWGVVEWHAKTLLAIVEGTCARWTLHAVLHWQYQTLQCNDCKEYPVPKEEAWEDANAEDISFQVY